MLQALELRKQRKKKIKKLKNKYGYTNAEIKELIDNKNKDKNKEVSVFNKIINDMEETITKETEELKNIYEKNTKTTLEYLEKSFKIAIAKKKGMTESLAKVKNDIESKVAFLNILVVDSRKLQIKIEHIKIILKLPEIEKFADVDHWNFKLKTYENLQNIFLQKQKSVESELAYLQGKFNTQYDQATENKSMYSQEAIDRHGKI